MREGRRNLLDSEEFMIITWLRKISHVIGEYFNRMIKYDV